jgi:hypothetical protein
LIAVGAAVAAAAGGIGQAQADSGSASGAPETIVVNGSDTETIASDADAATQQSTYETALAAAVANAGVKANVIATALGATLGSVDNVTEESSSSGDLCETYLPVEAASGGANGNAPTTTSTSTTGHKKKHKKHKAGALVRGVAASVPVGVPTPGPVGHGTVMFSSADTSNDTCSIEADVTVTYEMAGASS